MKRDESFGEFYDLSIADRAGRYLSMRKARKAFNGKQIRVAADIGCGFEASLGRALFSEAETLHLVDISVNKVGVKDHERIHEGYLPEVLCTFNKSSLDAILLNNVLEHLTDINGTLKELNELLDVNGVLFINVPTWRGKWLLEQAAFRFNLAPREEMNDHKMYFELESLWPRLVGAGFRPDAIKCKTHKFGTNLYAVCQKREIIE